MDIHSIQNNVYPTPPEINKPEETTSIQQASEPLSEPKSKDTPAAEYIPGKHKPTGLYSLSKDENGDLKILYDDPSKARETKPSLADRHTPVNPDSDSIRSRKSEEACTADTDKVDSEIQQLKQQKQDLKLQIKNAGDDEDKVNKLKNKLSQIETELLKKDTDTYRRQHAEYY